MTGTGALSRADRLRAAGSRAACRRPRARVVIAAAIVLVVVPSCSRSEDGGDAEPGAAPAPPRRAALVPVKARPLELRGNGFAPGERVSVTVSTGETRLTRDVRARPTGTFALSFPGMQTCNGVSADAVGSDGSRASFQLSSFGC